MCNTIEVLDSYFKMPNGDVFMLRQIGERYEWHGKVPVVFVEWSNAGYPWQRPLNLPKAEDILGKYFFNPQSFCRSLVKEGPKAIVKVS